MNLPDEGFTESDQGLCITFLCGAEGRLYSFHKDGRPARYWFRLAHQGGNVQLDARLLQWRYAHASERPSPDDGGFVPLGQMALEILPCFSLADAIRPAPAGFY